MSLQHLINRYLRCLKEEIHNSGDDDKIKTEAVEKDTQKKDEGEKNHDSNL